MGQYPVDVDDAVQMCAIQMQAENGPHLLQDPKEPDASLEKYLIPQVEPLLSVRFVQYECNSHPASFTVLRERRGLSFT